MCYWAKQNHCGFPKVYWDRNDGLVYFGVDWSVHGSSIFGLQCENRKSHQQRILCHEQNMYYLSKSGTNWHMLVTHIQKPLLVLYCKGWTYSYFSPFISLILLQVYSNIGRICFCSSLCQPIAPNTVGTPSIHLYYGLWTNTLWT